MTKYCALPDGRIKLLQKIKERLDYFISFDDFYRPMTRFHRAISPLYMVEDIITTNWDDFFERECMIDPFVYNSDMAFWDASSRRLMKIHGSISNFGSIVATNGDYRKSFKRLNNGPLGAQLKSLIARKTVIYVGYSLSDPNYLRLLKNISKMMGANSRQSYFISPNMDSKKLALAPVSLVPINTDGAFFFENVHEHFSNTGVVVKDKAFFDCDRFLDLVAVRHNKTADAYLKTRHSLLILALGYQDGLIHVMQRLLRLKKRGDYHSPNDIRSRIGGYEFRLNELIKKKDFWNACYAQGYQNGLLYLLAKHYDSNAPHPPIFAVPVNTKRDSLAAILKFPKHKIPKEIARQLNRIEKRSKPDLIPDHTPYL